jgi:hypothetical protein
MLKVLQHVLEVALNAVHSALDFVETLLGTDSAK